MSLQGSHPDPKWDNVQELISSEPDMGSISPPDATGSELFHNTMVHPAANMPRVFDASCPTGSSFDHDVVPQVWRRNQQGQLFGQPMPVTALVDNTLSWSQGATGFNASGQRNGVDFFVRQDFNLPVNTTPAHNNPQGHFQPGYNQSSHTFPPQMNHYMTGGFSATPPVYPITAMGGAGGYGFSSAAMSGGLGGNSGGFNQDMYTQSSAQGPYATQGPNLQSSPAMGNDDTVSPQDLQHHAASPQAMETDEAFATDAESDTMSETAATPTPAAATPATAATTLAAAATAPATMASFPVYDNAVTNPDRAREIITQTINSHKLAIKVDDWAEVKKDHLPHYATLLFDALLTSGIKKPSLKLGDAQQRKFDKQQKDALETLQGKMKDTVQSLEISCHCMKAVGLAVDLHEFGRSKQSIDAQSGKDKRAASQYALGSGWNLKCSNRLKLMIKMAKEYKLVALAIAKNKWSEDFIHHPEMYADSKVGYLKSNVRRAATLNESKGKEGMPKKRKAPTQRDEDVDGGSDTPQVAFDNGNTGASKPARKQPARATKRAKVIARKDADSEEDYTEE